MCNLAASFVATVALTVSSAQGLIPSEIFVEAAESLMERYDVRDEFGPPVLPEEFFKEQFKKAYLVKDGDQSKWVTLASTQNRLIVCVELTQAMLDIAHSKGTTDSLLGKWEDAQSECLMSATLSGGERTRAGALISAMSAVRNWGGQGSVLAL